MASRLFRFQNSILMRRLLFLILLTTCMLQQVFAQVAQSLWVGESYTCDATSAMMGLTSDKSWTTSGGYFSLSGSGSYRTVTISQYFSGIASVTFSWKERLTSNSQWKSRSKTWYFTCRDNQVYITPSSMTLSVGEYSYVGYSHQYDNSYTYAANAYFSSSNPAIVSVNEHTGEVLAKSPGTTYINVYSKISSNTPYCKVTVREVDVESVSIPNSVSIIAGESKQLSNTIYPSNATVKTTQWYTNDASIATINSSGVLTAVKHGVTKVYCVVNNSVKSNETTVTVSKSTLQLSASKEDGLLQKGTTVTLSANDADAEIYYTTDGSVPTRNSIRYEEGIIIEKNLILKAIACHEDYNTSEVLEKKYEVTSLEIVETYPVGTMKDYMIPYIKFNSAISKGQAFDLIKVSTSSADNALRKMIISDNVLYLVPQDSLMLESEVLIIEIPEFSVNNSNGEPNTAIKMTLKIKSSDSEYSLYAKEVYAGEITSSALLSNGTLLNWGAWPSESGGWISSFGLGKAPYYDDYNVKKSCKGADNHNAYIDKMGNLWIWGYNDWDCIGDGGNEKYYSPVTEYKVLENVKEVACGGSDSHTLALTNDGVLYGWGSNLYYQLSSEANKSYSTPQRLMTEVKHIYAGDRTSFIIKNDSSLWMRGTFGVSGSPYYITCKDWKKVDDNVILVTSLNDEVPMFIKSDNSLYYCSNKDFRFYNYNDQYRNREYHLFTSGFNVYSALKTNDIIDVSGSYSTGGIYDRGIYVKKDGSLWGWGRNDYGQLGNGTISEIPSITTGNAVKIMDDVRKVSVNWAYTLIVKEDGSIWGWGDNRHGNIKPSEYGDTRPTPELIWQSTKAPSATAVKINANKTTIGKEEQLPLNLIVEPSDAFCKNIQWKSSDEAIATVSQRGIVTGISEGKTTITAFIESHEGTTFKATCQIEVKGVLDVQEVQPQHCSCRINNSIVQIRNLRIGIPINIYSTTGIQYYQGFANNQMMYIPLKEKGVYIITVGNERFKAVNQ